MSDEVPATITSVYAERLIVYTLLPVPLAAPPEGDQVKVCAPVAVRTAIVPFELSEVGLEVTEMFGKGLTSMNIGLE